MEYIYISYHITVPIIKLLTFKIKTNLVDSRVTKVGDQLSS